MFMSLVSNLIKECYFVAFKEEFVDASHEDGLPYYAMINGNPK